MKLYLSSAFYVQTASYVYSTHVTKLDIYFVQK